MEGQEETPRNRVGRYHLVERIAVGGMAEVFLACERGTHALDRLLVIKRILPHLAENADFVEMFMAEAHHNAPLNEDGKLTSNLDSIGEEAERSGGRLIEGDGMKALREQRHQRAPRFA